MNIEAINGAIFTPTNQSMELAKVPQNDFSHWLTEKIVDTNKQLNSADQALTQLAAGQAENLHQTMLTLEQAKLSFQYLEQIRNRLMSAYQDLLRESI